MTKEIYKKIENYEDYAVSNQGNIKNVRTGRILKQRVNVQGYLVVDLYCEGKRKSSYAHRLVALAFLEKVKDKTVVDHQNGNESDNRASNLRWTTVSENGANRKKQSKKASSKYKGVTFCKYSKKWKACIYKKKKQITIGYFSTEIEAGKAYDERAKELFGEFAKLNFEPEDN